MYQYTRYCKSSLLNDSQIKERLKECEIGKHECVEIMDRDNQWCESSAMHVIELEAQIVVCNKYSDILLFQLNNNVIMGIMNRAIGFPCPKKLDHAEQIWHQKQEVDQKVT